MSNIGYFFLSFLINALEAFLTIMLFLLIIMGFIVEPLVALFAGKDSIKSSFTVKWKAHLIQEIKEFNEEV